MQPEGDTQRFVSQRAEVFPDLGGIAQTRQSFEKETSGMNWDRIPRANGSRADQPVTEETRNAYGQWQEKVKKVLTEKLDVSEEELTDAMERLGITFENLLTGEGLQELCMELTGAADITDLLFDGGFQELMQEIGILLDQLSEQVNLSPEELQAMMQKFMAESAVGEEMEANAPVQEPDAGMVSPAETDVVIAEEGASAESLPVDQQTVEAVVDQQQTAEMVAEPQKSAEEQAAIQPDQQPQNTAHPAEEQAPEQSAEQPAEGEGVREETVDEPQIQKGGAQTEQETEFSQNGQQEEKELTGQWKAKTGEEPRQVSHFERDSQQVSFQTTVQNTVTGTGEAVVQTVQRTFVDVQDILQQISEFTRVTVTRDVSTLEMQLNPEHLGKLYMQLSSREGVITAQLIAQNEAVKHALESQVNVLKENMNNQGMKVEAVEVTVASHEFEEQFQSEQQMDRQQEQESPRQRRFLNVEQLDELSGQLSEEDSLAARIMVENGNSVDMTA